MEKEKYKWSEETHETFPFKKQENSPGKANNETNLCSLIDTEFKRKIVKMLKELKVNMKKIWADIKSSTDYFRKELEIMSSQENFKK